VKIKSLPEKSLSRLTESAPLDKNIRKRVIVSIVEQFCDPQPGRRALRIICHRLCSIYPALKPEEVLLVKVEERMYNHTRAKHQIQCNLSQSWETPPV
jgi:hypothetical protein